MWKEILKKEIVSYSSDENWVNKKTLDKWQKITKEMSRRHVSSVNGENANVVFQVWMQTLHLLNFIHFDSRAILYTCNRTWIIKHVNFIYHLWSWRKLFESEGDLEFDSERSTCTCVRLLDKPQIANKRKCLKIVSKSLSSLPLLLEILTGLL